MPCPCSTVGLAHHCPHRPIRGLTALQETGWLEVGSRCSARGAGVGGGTSFLSGISELGGHRLQPPLPRRPMRIRPSTAGWWRVEERMDQPSTPGAGISDWVRTRHKPPPHPKLRPVLFWISPLATPRSPAATVPKQISSHTSLFSFDSFFFFFRATPAAYGGPQARC